VPSPEAGDRFLHDLFPYAFFHEVKKSVGHSRASSLADQPESFLHFVGDIHYPQRSHE
jgi:hypothetical protein